jgi:hypothetical protein
MRALGWLLALSLIPAVANAAQLVANGDFEDPNIGVTTFVHVGDGGTIGAWSVDAPTPSQGVDIISNRTGCTSCANTGEQAVDMAGTPGRGDIFQDLATVAGTTYRLTFFVSSNIGPFSDSLSISWDGAVFDTIDTPAQGVWQQFTYDLLAIDASTELRFIGNRDGLQGAFLDTVSVIDVQTPAVPSPAALPLLGVGLLLLAASRRR